MVEVNIGPSVDKLDAAHTGLTDGTATNWRNYQPLKMLLPSLLVKSRGKVASDILFKYLSEFKDKAATEISSHNDYFPIESVLTKKHNILLHPNDGFI